MSDLVAKEIILTGSVVGNRQDIKEMLQFAADNNVYPIVEEFAFDDFPKALDKLENGRPQFRCVVNVQEFSKNNGLFQ